MGPTKLFTPGETVFYHERLSRLPVFNTHFDFEMRKALLEIPQLPRKKETHLLSRVHRRSDDCFHRTYGSFAIHKALTKALAMTSFAHGRPLQMDDGPGLL